MWMAVGWMNTRAAPFGRMIDLRQFVQLDQVFARALIQSTVAAVIAFTGVWSVIVFLRIHHIAFSLRLLPPVTLALLMLATLVNIVVSALALYLRAHKQEKFMVNSIMGALWTGPAALVLGRA